MKVVFNTWTAAFFQKGGGEVQLEKSQQYLRKLNIDIVKYDMWAPQRNQDILHHFSMMEGARHVIEAYKSAGSKVCISPILWPTGQQHEYDGLPYVKYCFNLSDIIFTNSNLESELLSNFYGISIEKFHKTRNGVDPEFFELADEQLFRRRYHIEGPFVLCLANIDRRKNLDKLVTACQMLGIKLVSIGHIKDEAYFNEFARTSKNVHFLGPIENIPMIKSALRACEVFALPSYCETPGLAALEAGAQKCKIIITSEGSTTEYFGDDVTYINPTDLDSIVTGLKKEIEITRDSEKLRNHIIANYSWELTAQDILSGYKKILNVN